MRENTLLHIQNAIAFDWFVCISMPQALPDFV
jgi:hypothetical protein